ncbi:MAG: porin family protein [Saprospiraceae bacterium]|nr:porin family protein [Saprospiraceae bacterium]
MKKIALLLFFTSFLLAEVEAQKGVRFGFQASPSWSWIRTNERKIEGVSSNWGVKLGALGEFYFADNYAITTGLGFGFNQGGSLQNGYAQFKPWDESDLLEEIPSDVFGPDSKFHYRLNYVEIPLGLKMRGGSNEDSRTKFYAEAPIFTLGFVTKGTGDIRGTNTQNLEDIDIKNEVRGMSLSWGFGAGIEYEFATNATLVTGLVFQKQFTDMTRSELVSNEPTGDLSKEDSKATFGNIALRIAVFF